MYYPDNVISDIKNSVSIVSVIGSRVSLKRSGSSDNYFGLCPFHNEKSGSFCVNERKKLFKCFGCGKGGSVFTFLMEYEHMTYPEAIEALADEAGIELPTVSYSNEEKAKFKMMNDLKEIHHKAVNYYYSMLNRDPEQKAANYFKNRGITEETIKNFGLGYAPVTSDALYNYLKNEGYSDDLLKESRLVRFKNGRPMDLFYNRVMFPIINEQGKTIAFGGRLLYDGKPKYINSDESMIFSKRRNLFGLYQARRSKRPGYILCEGYMDVISMHQAGFDNAVASLGTAFTFEQADILKKKSKDAIVYLAYDSDDAGQSATMKAIQICRDKKIKCRIISLKPYKDPDEFIKDPKGLLNNPGTEEYEKRITSAISDVEYLVKIRESEFNLDDPMDKNEFAKSCVNVFAQVEDPLERDIYEEKFCKEYGINKSLLHKQVVTRGEAMLEEQKAKEIKEERQRERTNLEKEFADGNLLNEKRVLTIAGNYPLTWKKIRQWLEIEDFTDGVTKKIAEKYEDHLFRYNEIRFDELLDAFPDVEDHSLVSDIVNQQLDFDGMDSGNDSVIAEKLSEMLNVFVQRVKLAAINRMANSDGEKDVRLLMEIKQKQTEAKNIKIEINPADLKV